MKSTKRIIKVGVVGCGYWGPNLVRNLRQSADCQLKVLCDASEPRLAHMRRLHPDVAATSQYKNLLEDTELDAVTGGLVVIRVPNIRVPTVSIS